MADNIAQNGTNTVATDDIGGIHYQRSKRSLGRDGTAADAATAHRLISAAGANQDATVVKASAGVLYGFVCTNINAAVRYLKIYNLASGATSASTPIFTFAIPGSVTGAGAVIPLPVGVDFSTGISLRLTTGVADNDANAVAANELIVNSIYV
jgi:hypothetical protein